MRVLIVGKFPPIQGGVSAQTYFTAHELARRGHDVFVVTNAPEVEWGFREVFFDGDENRLGKSKAEGRGSVTVRATTPLEPTCYLPWARPYATQLTGLATRVAREERVDLVIGSYFEPYGIAATHAARETGAPLALQHAGSDIGYLAKNDDLREAYRSMLAQARWVLTVDRTEIRDDLAALGVSDAQMRFSMASALPEELVAPSEPLHLQSRPEIISAWLASSDLPARVVDGLRALHTKRYDPDLPTIGIYGKVGEVKGSFDLLRAAERLAQRGLEFQLVVIATGAPDDLVTYHRALLESPSVAERTWVVPPIAPWRISSFVRGLTAACALERAFPISYHGSGIAREVLAAGTCLVCSKDAARATFLDDNLVDGKNYLLVPDPREIGALEERLAFVISEPERAREIAARGIVLSRAWESRMHRLPIVGTIEQLVAS